MKIVIGMKVQSALFGGGNQFILELIKSFCTESFVDGIK